jgi:hypothetical protein
MEQEQFELADDLLGHAVELLNEHGAMLPQIELGVVLVRADCAILQGHWGTALRHASRAWELATQVGIVRSELAALCVRAVADARTTSAHLSGLRKQANALPLSAPSQERFAIRWRIALATARHIGVREGVEALEALALEAGDIGFHGVEARIRMSIRRIREGQLPTDPH